MGVSPIYGKPHIDVRTIIEYTIISGDMTCGDVSVIFFTEQGDRLDEDHGGDSFPWKNISRAWRWGSSKWGRFIRPFPGLNSCGLLGLSVSLKPYHGNRF